MDTEIVGRLNESNVTELTPPSEKKLILKAAGYVQTSTPNPNAPKLKSEAWKRLSRGEDILRLSFGPAEGYPEWVLELLDACTERNGVKFEPSVVVVEAGTAHDKSNVVQTVPFAPDGEAAVWRILENRELWESPPKFGTEEFGQWIEKLRRS